MFEHLQAQYGDGPCRDYFDAVEPVRHGALRAAERPAQFSERNPLGVVLQD